MERLELTLILIGILGLAMAFFNYLMFTKFVEMGNSVIRVFTNSMNDFTKILGTELKDFRVSNDLFQQALVQHAEDSASLRRHMDEVSNKNQHLTEAILNHRTKERLEHSEMLAAINGKSKGSE